MRKLKLLFASLLMVLACNIAVAQNITVKGVVTDANTGETIPFASIQVKGTMTGTATDVDGNYAIECPRNARRRPDSQVTHMPGNARDKAEPPESPIFLPVLQQCPYPLQPYGVYHLLCWRAFLPSAGKWTDNTGQNN